MFEFTGRDVLYYYCYCAVGAAVAVAAAESRGPSNICKIIIRSFVVERQCVIRCACVRFVENTHAFLEEKRFSYATREKHIINNYFTVAGK